MESGFGDLLLTGRYSPRGQFLTHHLLAVVVAAPIPCHVEEMTPLFVLATMPQKNQLIELIGKKTIKKCTVFKK